MVNNHLSYCLNVSNQLNECRDEANEEGLVDQNVELSPVLMYIGRKVDVVQKIESTMHEAYSTRHSTRLTEKKSAKKMVKKDSGKAVCIIYG
ncbi:hypothetical protein Tco_1470957 [Tanacetum coccineum]